MSDPAPRFSPRPSRAAEIAWLPFGPEAFAQARRQGRPLLLAIGAVWCHWCHVMDETSYSDERVLALLRDRFVAVRVDRDQRPDVDRRYNQGGWPTTCVLNAAGSLLWGATYVPPDAFARVLARLADAYAQDPSLAEALPPAAAREDGAGALARAAAEGSGEGLAAVVDAVLVAMAALEDRHFGGFGREGPKFPQAESLGFILALAPWPGPRAESARAMLARALDGMLAGELEDRVEGGFYRYATQPDWREPHYEKMLWDNALLASAYLRAGARAGEARWLEAGRRALAFLDGVLWQESVVAYAMSQDADEEYARLDLPGRRARSAPYLDTVVYADGNLVMVETLVDAWAVSGDEGALRRAARLWDGLTERLYRPGEGFLHCDAGPAREVMDQVLALGAALALEPLGRPRDLALARSVADDLLATGAAEGRLVERPLGGWQGPESWRGAPAMPLVAEGGRAARHLLALGRRLGDERYARAARRLVEGLSAEAGRLGTFGADLARAAWHFRSPVTVRVAAPAAGAAAVASLFAAARRSAVEPLAIALLGRDEAEAEGLSAGEAGAAYACLGEVCAAPASHASELVEAIRGLVARSGSELVW